MNHNIVTLEPKNVVSVTAVGAQTYDTVKDVENQVRVITNQLRAQNRPVKILIELSPGVSQDLTARRAAREFLTSLDYDKIGMYGAKMFLKNVIDLIIAGSVRNGRVKNFYTKEEALRWLAD
jgi:hypothetical protein